MKVGDTAPDFELDAQTGDGVRLSEFRGESVVVLYFYPKDDSPVCTREACAFRDSYEQFKEAGAEVLGISSDSLESHGMLALKLGLPFRLLTDDEGEVRRLFGVPSSLGLIPGRATYVLDKDGVVRHVFNSQINAERHIEESLKTIQSLR